MRGCTQSTNHRFLRLIYSQVSFVRLKHNIHFHSEIIFSIAALVKQAIPSCSIFIVKNDEINFEVLRSFIPYFSAILVGPGPGSPQVPSDVGVVRDLWHLEEYDLLPIFGVCLGLQSLGVEHGATIRKLNVVKHGQVSNIKHSNDSLFASIPQGAAVVRYHSLCIDVNSASFLERIAWVNDEERDGEVVMAIKHRSKPFWGVQYHPESICTDRSGLLLLNNFWKLAQDWCVKYRRSVKKWDACVNNQFSQNAWPPLPSLSINEARVHGLKPSVLHTTFSAPNLTVPQICEILGVYKANTDFVLLDSAAKPGSFSIIACILPSTPKIHYYVGEQSVSVIRGQKREQEACPDIWSWLSDFMRSKEFVGGNPSVPFWGGLAGYLSYELGVEALNCAQRKEVNRQDHFPDVNFVFVERSLVVQVETGQITLQSLIPNDDGWMNATKSLLKRAAFGEKLSNPSSSPPLSPLAKVTVSLPDKSAYIEKVKAAQELLYKGESYELCLTARSRLLLPKVPTPSSLSSWDFYKKVRKANPAPFAAYVRLYPSILVSSSPERFLSYSRPPSQRYQLRPIKGTVKKGKGITRTDAEEILNSPKEIGENLMIVDLIRHDLYGVIGPSVFVKKFCGIEEYETVWQLVSVIEGEQDVDVNHNDQLGWEVLHKSFPPGSMTGAPKKRSVQLLQELEDSDRGIYSGVVGYWCVGGSGDWSVVIRSCFKMEQDSSEDSCGLYDEWHIGAGGAITALSDPESEWEEMVTKLESVLKAFPVDE